MASISKWSDKATAALAGKTVKEVRYLTEEEQRHFMWHESGPVIVFEDGSSIAVSQDNEGNGPGALFYTDSELPVIPTIRP